MIRLCALALVVMATAGCLPRNAFGPGPDNWQMWIKPGAEEVTIWKDLLECNYAQPFGGGGKIEGGSRTINETVGSMICMERLGYTFTEARPGQGVCQTSSWPRLGKEACTTGKDVPVPDPERRLKGGYCKKYPQSPACVP